MCLRAGLNFPPAKIKRNGWKFLIGHPARHPTNGHSWSATIRNTVFFQFSPAGARFLLNSPNAWSAYFHALLTVFFSRHTREFLPSGKFEWRVIGRRKIPDEKMAGPDAMQPSLFFVFALFEQVLVTDAPTAGKFG